ncbi:MAG: ABC transporter ATP-binding protein [Oscillospiraceae bacterium]|jgi:ATP-binding cassette subfamily B protein|nr:ABC transporter ATP-binding protein [Oscillospiraceae bacterium]
MQILKYIRKTWLAVLGCFVLLAGQAMCDLALPTYTGNIVNVGISQGGIPDAVPEQMRAGTLDTMVGMMSADQAAQVAASYTLENGGIYRLKDAVDRPALAEIFETVIAKEAQDLVGGKAYTAKDLLPMLQLLGTDLPVDESTLNLLYYGYASKGKESNPMPMGEFITLLQETVKNPALASQLDAESQAGVEQLTKFADAEAMQTPADAPTLGGMLGMGEEETNQILLLYFTTYGGTDPGTMTLKAFADYLVNDLLPNPEFSDSVDADTAAQIQQMQTFTDKQTIQKQMTAAELAALMGMKADEVKLLYTYQKAMDSAYKPSGMTMSAFLTYLVNTTASNAAVASALSADQTRQIQLLKPFTTKAGIEQQRTSAEMAKLFGMEESAIEGIYALYRTAKFDWFKDTFSAKEFIDYVVADVAGNPAFASQITPDIKAQLTMLQKLAAAVMDGKTYSAAQLASLMGIDANMVKLLLAMREPASVSDKWTLSPQEAIAFLTANSAALGSALPAAQLAELKTVQSLMEGVLSEKAYTPKELSTLLGMPENDIRSLFYLHQSSTGDTAGWKLTPQDFLNFFAKDVVPNPAYSERITPEAAQALTAMRDLVNAVVDGKARTPAQTAEIMAGFGDQLDSGMVELLYMYKDSQADTDTERALSAEQLLGYLSQDVAKDPRFAALLPAEAKEALAKLEEQMSGDGSLLNIDFSNPLVRQQVAIQLLQSEYEVLGMDMGKLQRDYMFRMGFMMLAIVLISTVAAIGAAALASWVGAKNSFDLRRQIYRKILSFSGAEVDQFSPASLITRSTNDIQQIQLALVLTLRMVLYAPILGIGGILKVSQTKTGMGWVVVMSVGVMFVLIGILVIVALPKFRILQTLVDKVNLISREILTGIPVIRAFAREKEEEERFEGANDTLMRTQMFINRGMSIMFPVMLFLMNALAVLIIWVGGHKMDSGNMAVGDMLAFITYTIQIVMAFMMLSLLSVILPRAGVAAGRVEEVLEAEPTIYTKPDARHITEVVGTVEFRDVSFHYPTSNESVLHHVSFTALPGQTTAIIGGTGSGKSSLVNLIPRLYDVTEGSVTLDGVDVRDLDVTELRAGIGFVPQKGILFSGTITENIGFSDDKMPAADIRHAAAVAQAAEFIDRKEDGYESSIAQGGSNVSGGQKQRLSIARALAKRAKVLVFDDSFSALDFKTDAALRRALANDAREATVIIVAQRISTVLHAQQIVVLEEGNVVGIGTHEELMANCPVYADIARSQLNAQELGAKEGA